MLIAYVQSLLAIGLCEDDSRSLTVEDLAMTMKPKTSGYAILVQAV